MSRFGFPSVDRLRKPEFTGENRCEPCTVLNIAIAIGVSLLVAFVMVELALVLLAISLAAIYLRGYLIPGTPTLTKRYLPAQILEWFGPNPLEAEQQNRHEWRTLEKIDYERRHAIDPEQFLTDEDVISPCDDGDDVCFTDEFATLVERLTEEHRHAPMNREIIADMFEADSDDVEPLDRDYPAVKIRQRVRKWPSNGALVADIATHEGLGKRTDRWNVVPFEQRQRILESLRGFHEICPLCSGEIRYYDDVVESCCAEYQVTRIACVDCDERLLEFDPSQIGPDANIKGFTP